jgi:hypothetical protein
VTALEAIEAALLEAEIRYQRVPYSLNDGVERVCIMVDDSDDEDRRIELNFTESNGRLTGILSTWNQD